MVLKRPQLSFTLLSCVLPTSEMKQKSANMKIILHKKFKDLSFSLFVNLRCLGATFIMFISRKLDYKKSGVICEFRAENTDDA